MAITKLPRNAIADDAVNADKIEDGTIQAVEISGTITNAKLASSTIANAKLSNSTISIRGQSRALGDSFSINVDVDWQSVKTGNTSMSAGQGYFVDTSSGAINMTLPSSASAGDTIAIKDYAGTFATNSCVIVRNGHNIQGIANNSELKTNRASVVLVYVDSTKGWLFTTEQNVSDLQVEKYIAATGGTVTTSGNFKVHTFTGDGCFIVSCAGNDAGSNTVDYLVVAGGGGGGHDNGGGGGAGGFRLSNSTCMPSPQTSPLATPTAIPVTATTFPITVGGGGAGGCSSPGGTNGSNSSFSTITSAGGGKGGPQGADGGSGGGNCTTSPTTRGAGNTPPVSPPQGNDGGLRPGGAPSYSGGGGGGAGAAGQNSSGPSGGNGGAGSFVVQCGFGGCNGTTGPVCGARYFAGGGSGGGQPYVNPVPGCGGVGGGGKSMPSSCKNATANTGGGGGGGASPAVGGTGGKGIVIIRYKFQ